MIYVFDSSTLIHLFRYYYPDRFPSLWERFAHAVDADLVISVDEVLREIGQHDDLLSAWAKDHRSFFQYPEQAELGFVKEIFRIPHFEALVRQQELLQGKAVADPFVIAKARVLNGCVVTEEACKPNAAKIPNVCQHFGTKCITLEGFMKIENWVF